MTSATYQTKVPFSLVPYCEAMGFLYGLSSDTAAALVLARRALRKSERVPANLARELPVDRNRHSWSYWNSLLKKFNGVRRHDFFKFNAANSGMVVTPVDELEPLGTDRLTGKLS